MCDDNNKRFEDRIDCINKELAKIRLARAEHTQRVRELKKSLKEIEKHTTPYIDKQQKKDEDRSNKPCKWLLNREKCIKDVQEARFRLDYFADNDRQGHNIKANLQKVDKNVQIQTSLLDTAEATKERIISGRCDDVKQRVQELNNKIRPFVEMMDREHEDCKRRNQRIIGATCKPDKSLLRVIASLKAEIADLQDCDGMS
jgi:hypothetical protein